MFTQQELKVQGSVEAGFERVKLNFERNFQNGDEISSQLCVFHKGKKVVDLWGSTTDPSYNGDTLQTIWSSSKNVTALCLAMLIDRGLLEYNDKVADYWPEFGQENKGDITVADVMRHEAGMPFFDEQLRIEDSFRENLQSNGVGKIIEKQNITYLDENKRREYHALTRGFIIQELFRRVDVKGRSIGTFLKEEVTDLLSADVFLGLDVEDQKSKNIANVIAMSDEEVQDTAEKNGRVDILDTLDRYRAVQGETEGKRKEHKSTWCITDDHSGPLGSMSLWNSQNCRRAEIPSAGVLSSAKGLCAIANMLANFGSINGRTFISKEGWEKMHGSPTEGETFGMETFYTQGGVNHYKDGRKYPSEKVSPGPHGTVHYGQLIPQGMYGWGGYGGSLFLWDPAHQVGFVYIPTYLAWYDSGKLRATNLLAEVYQCLEALHK